jgi:proline dehydrogenase
MLERLWVSGAALEDAARVVKALNRKGVAAEVDYLGEFVTRREDAEEATREYLSAAKALKRADAALSVKLSLLGMGVDEDLCAKNLERIAASAKFVWIDAEREKMALQALALYARVLKKRKNVGMTIQAALKRSGHDARRVARMRGASVRLTKGAYREPLRVSFASPAAMLSNYLTLMKFLAKRVRTLQVATQDERVIAEALRMRPKAKIEFATLYGVRPDIVARLAGTGHRVVVYVPYGMRTGGYVGRRLNEVFRREIAGLREFWQWLAG